MMDPILNSLSYVHKIEIKTKKLVNDILGGEYESVFKGRGIEFSDVREYVPGDDIRTIDWNVTARFQTPFVKQFVEERELNVLFLFDSSGSCHFGTAAKTKSEISAEISALLAFSAVKNNDKVGLVIYSDQIEKYIPIKKGPRHVLRVIREILYFQPKHKKTSITNGLEFANKILTRRAIIFIISDFFDVGFENAIKIVAKKHDVIAIHLIDPSEISFVSAGLIQFEDAEDETIILIDSSEKGFRDHFIENSRIRVSNLMNFFNSIKVDVIPIDTSKPYLDPIIKFFKAREKRVRID